MSGTWFDSDWTEEDEAEAEALCSADDEIMRLEEAAEYEAERDRHRQEIEEQEAEAAMCDQWVGNRNWFTEYFCVCWIWEHELN